ncbi:hypothetical protein [Streptomyces sp. CBMA29]|uniref:hypothetical protein n=1 Tax=Streptomyces sp. CBMA29 TaxID=1896314 RepID=UPI001661ED6E|nr:hypothetical protein [Streptomyces sp. CBMA29]MBD0734003.1 hypothetical protein [Streptomyces sp. CBMA29]
MKFEADGSVNIKTHHYPENKSKPNTLNHFYRPDDVVAIVAMEPLGNSGMDTYANHDDRLILPGGYLAAHPGTMHEVWDAFREDGTRIEDSVTVAEGRALLSALGSGE